MFALLKLNFVCVVLFQVIVVQIKPPKLATKKFVMNRGANIEKFFKWKPGIPGRKRGSVYELEEDSSTVSSGES